MADNIVEKIVLGLEVQTKKGLDSVREAVAAIQKLLAPLKDQPIEVVSPKSVSELEKTKVLLSQLTAEYNSLTKETQAYQGRLKAIAVDQKEVNAIWARMIELQGNFRISEQKAGQILIQNGEASLTAVNKTLQLKERELLTTSQVEAAMGKLQQQVNKLTKAEMDAAAAEEKQNKALEKQQKEASKTADSFGKLQQRVVAFLSAIGIAASIGQFVEFLKEATAAGVEFAQVQFNLGVQVRAAQRAIGIDAAGSMEVWKKKIVDLRKELGIFSEVSITKAITQTSVLTRVLGLNADQQEEVVRLASVLAQSTGTDLASAVDDVTKAMGGSSVVLDKYGLFIRDVDKAAAAFELGFTDKLQAGTNGLNSQQLAMATLQTVMKQVKPLMAEMVGYQDTLPGKLKVMDAQIADQMKDVGANFGEFLLGFKMVWSGILEIFNEILNNEFIVKAREAIDMLYKLYNVRKDLAELQNKYDTAQTITPEGDRLDWYNMSSGALGKTTPEGFDDVTGIRYYLDYQLKLDKEALEKYHEEVAKAIADAKAKMGKELEDLGGKYAPAATAKDPFGPKGFGESDLPTHVPTPEEMSDAEKALLEMDEKFGEQMVDAWKDRKKEIQKIEADHVADLIKIDADYYADLEKLNREANLKQASLDRDYSRKLEDLETKRLRDIDSIYEDEARQREKIQQESVDRTAEIWEDYYRKLGELNNQFYYDLQDAVAENDAVAIKKLERKYALDKAKLDGSLNDQLNDQQEGVQDRLDELEEETRQRREELERRHQEELEDLEKWKKREQEDMVTWFTNELYELNRSLAEKRSATEAAYQADLQAAQIHYQERLYEIMDSLAREYDAEYEHLFDLLTLYDEYIGNDGAIRKLIHEFYNYKAQLAGGGSLDDSEWGPGSGSGSGSGGGGVGMVKPSAQSNNTLSDRLYSVMLTSDGTVGDAVLESVARNLSEIIETVLVGRGNYVGMR